MTSIPKVMTPASKGACLYPIVNKYRDFRELTGLWNFKVDWDDSGLDESWHTAPLGGEVKEVPVPSSYNDLFVDEKIRDHVGAVYYERRITIPRGWEKQAIHLRFEAVAHHATVWLDGECIGRHKGGFLPFAINLTSCVVCGESYRLTIRCDNRLDWTCLPPGEHRVEPHPKDPQKTRRVQEIHFDFFNYGGMHRPVKLLALSRDHISSLKVTTNKITETTWKLIYKSAATGDASEGRVCIRDSLGLEIASGEGLCGEILIESPALWQPGKGILYTLEVTLCDSEGIGIDRYSDTFGFRTVSVGSNTFLINGEPFYFKGFGKHEDAAIRGRCLDLPILVRDFSLLEWIGANSVRTSHYPYSEEFMQMADRAGLVVIDEVPAVGFNKLNGETIFTPEIINEATKAHHIDVLRDLIARDGNRPAVVMWSIANEAATYQPESRPYFEAIAEETRRLDPTRPITVVEDQPAMKSHIADLVDVICVNRYYGWYEYCADMELAEVKLEEDLVGWHQRFGKPVLIAEYGVDTIQGFHSVTKDMFTEEFQIDFVSRYHAIFDRLSFVIGEHVWNFADFATKPGIKRVWGNRKGVFSRERHPKSIAYYLRERWRVVET